MDLNLKGKVAVITGPAKGMGAAITMAFAAEGARLALVARDVAAVEPVAGAARAQALRRARLRLRLTDAGQCEKVAGPPFGRIDF